MKKRTLVTTLLISISGFLLMLWFVLPSITLKFGYVPIAIASALLFVVVFIFDESNRKIYAQTIILGALFALIYFLVPYFFRFKDSLNIFQQIVIFSVPGCLSIFIITRIDTCKTFDMFLKIIKYIIIGLFIFITIQTLIARTEYADICRLLASSQEYQKGFKLVEFRERNVGGFGYAYSLGFIFLFLVDKIVKYEKQKKIFYICATAFMIWLIIVTQYATLFILCAIFAFVIIEKNLSGNKKVVLLIVMLFLGAIGVLALFIIEESDLNLENNPIYYVISVFSNDEISTSLRSQYWRDSLKVFSKNILFGFPNIKNDYEVYSIAVKSHSTQLKIMVETGLAGTLLYNIYLFTIKNFIANKLKIKGYDNSVFKIAFYMLWTLSWLNPIYEVFELSFTLFLFVPLLCCNEQYKKIKIGDERYK